MALASFRTASIKVGGWVCWVFFGGGCLFVFVCFWFGVFLSWLYLNQMKWQQVVKNSFRSLACKGLNSINTQEKFERHLR